MIYIQVTKNYTKEKTLKLSNLLVKITYFNYLLFSFKFCFVWLENSAKFAQKLFLSRKLFVEIAEVVAAIIVVVVILKKNISLTLIL
jgi:hypothetical protein